MFSLVLLQEGVCYDQCVLLTKLCYPLPCYVLYSKTKFACYSRYLLTSYFCISVPYNEKGIFLGCSRMSCRSSCSALLVEAKTCITVILNVLPWKQTEIILSFLRLPPSTAFQTLIDCDSYSISSMGFLSTVVDVMVT